MGKQLRALTLDFWNTIADGSSGQAARARERHKLILDAVYLPPDSLNLQKIAQAEAAVIAEYEEQRLVHLQATTALEVLQRTCDRLNCPLPHDNLEHLVFALQHGIDDAPPILAPGVSEVLPILARQFKLAIISDTLYAPGRVITDFLNDRNLGDCFDAFVFSDATGVVKPHPLAFQTALDHLEVSATETAHIGDLIRTDITGARMCGISAIQYTGILTDKNKGEIPHAILTDWFDLPDLLRRLFSY